MDILLISPNYNNRQVSFCWSVLSLGSYLSGVERRKVELLDANAYSEKVYYQKLASFCSKTKIVGISLMSPDTYFAKNTVDYIKSIDQGIKIIAGGPHVMLKPEQTCLYKNIDFVAYGEGERTLSALIKKIEANDKKYNDVSGLIYKEGGRLKRTIPSIPIGFYDTDFNLLPETTKNTFPEYIQVLTGRGCSFLCTFCFNSVCGQEWRGRPISEVIGEIDGLVGEYNPKTIYFRDENFFHSPDRVREFIKYYRKRKYNFAWRANCRASYCNENYLNLDLLKELEAINCRVLKFGIESGSQRVLNYFKKGLKIEHVERLVYAFSKVKKITPAYSFIIGVPSETAEEYASTLRLIRFIAKYNPNAKIVGPQYFRIYPGGELYEEVVKKYHYAEPASFEEWALRHSPDNDPYSFNKNISYPWIKPGYAFFVQHVDTLVLSFMQDIRRYLSIRLIWHLPFILLAKMRMRLGWYGALFDIRFTLIMRKLKMKHHSCPNWTA